MRSAASAVRRLAAGLGAARPAPLLDPDVAVSCLGIRARPTTADLWSAWSVSEIEAGLALEAWTVSRGAHRRRAYRAYRDALAREAWLASLLVHAARG